MVADWGRFWQVIQSVSAIAFLWVAAPAPAGDESATTLIVRHDAERQSSCDAEGCPTPCECATGLPLAATFGRNFQLQAGGFARLDLIHDFDPILDRYEFVTTSIPTDGRVGSQTTVSARQTRFNLDLVHTHTSLRVFAEGDFFGPGGDFRLRHAYGEFHSLLIGQNWSTFQDESIIPTTLDYEGPVGMVLVRQPQLRLSIPCGDYIELAGAIEDASHSDANVDIPFTGADDYRLPDLVGRLRYELPSAHMQISSVLRQVSFRGPVVPGQSVTGWGVAVSGALRPQETDQFYAQFAFGQGFARYVEDLAGTNSDAALDLNGNLIPLTTIGFFSGWQHRWTDCVHSNLVFGLADVSNSPAQSPDAFHQSEYASGNVIWSPLDDLDLGCEALWGNRRDKNRAYGEAVRFQFTTTVHF